MGLLSLVGLHSLHCGLAPGPMSPMPPPLSVGTTLSSGIPIPVSVRIAAIFVPGLLVPLPTTAHCPVASPGLPM